MFQVECHVVIWLTQLARELVTSEFHNQHSVRNGGQKWNSNKNGFNVNSFNFWVNLFSTLFSTGNERPFFVNALQLVPCSFLMCSHHSLSHFMFIGGGACLSHRIHRTSLYARNLTRFTWEILNEIYHLPFCISGSIYSCALGSYAFLPFLLQTNCCVAYRLRERHQTPAIYEHEFSRKSSPHSLSGE